MHSADSFPAPTPRILVVDDEPAILTLIQLFLQGEDWQIITAPDGEEGLRRFQQGKFDLVITDRAMPRLDGVAMARALKLHSPHTPIILMTGLLTPMIDATPFEGFLTKPFTGTQLRATVAGLLSAPNLC